MNNSKKAEGLQPRRYPILILQTDPAQWLTIRLAMEHCFSELEPIWMSKLSTASAYLDTVSVIPRALPRLIFIDLSLPAQEEGLAFLMQLKADPRYDKIPVVILNQSEVVEDVLQAFALGAASFVTKPVNYLDWLRCFNTLKPHWWELAKLPISI